MHRLVVRRLLDRGAVSAGFADPGRWRVLAAERVPKVARSLRQGGPLLPQLLRMDAPHPQVHVREGPRGGSCRRLRLPWRHQHALAHVRLLCRDDGRVLPPEARRDAGDGTPVQFRGSAFVRPWQRFQRDGGREETREDIAFKLCGRREGCNAPHVACCVFKWESRAGTQRRRGWVCSLDEPGCAFFRVVRCDIFRRVRGQCAE